jgi:hypothetical protein
MVLTLTLEHLALGNGLVLDGLKLAAIELLRVSAMDEKRRKSPAIS